MRRIVSFLLSVCMVLGLCACGQKADVKVPSNVSTWQEQYDLGLRYFSEGNYEEAIIAFIAAIEIDPKNADTYLGLADVYIALGQTEEALDMIKRGLAQCGDLDSLMAKLEELGDYSMYYSNDLFRPTEMTVGGRPYWELSLEEVAGEYPDGKYYETDNGNTEYDAYVKTPNGTHCWVLCALVGSNTGRLQLRYDSFLNDGCVGFSTELRGLCCGQNMDEVLSCLGLTEAGIAKAKASNFSSLRVQDGKVTYFECHDYDQEGHSVYFSLLYDDFWLTCGLDFNAQGQLKSLWWY